MQIAFRYHVLTPRLSQLCSNLSGCAVGNKNSNYSDDAGAKNHFGHATVCQCHGNSAAEPTEHSQVTIKYYSKTNKSS